RKLAHGPQPSAIAGRMDAAGERKFAREGEITLKIEIGDVVRRRERIDLHAAHGGEIFLPGAALSDDRIVDFPPPSRSFLADGAKSGRRKKRSLLLFALGLNERCRFLRLEVATHDLCIISDWQYPRPRSRLTS